MKAKAVSGSKKRARVSEPTDVKVQETDEIVEKPTEAAQPLKKASKKRRKTSEARSEQEMPDIETDKEMEQTSTIEETETPIPQKEPLSEKRGQSQLQRTVFPASVGSGVVFLSNLPTGFFEDQIFNFFRQFGQIGRIKLVRNPKTCTPRGLAFVQFRVKEVAEIVAKTMNNYVIGQKALRAVCLTDEEAADPRVYSGPRNFREWWKRRIQVTNSVKNQQGLDNVSPTLVLGLVKSEASFSERLIAAGVDPSEFTPIRLLPDEMVEDEAKLAEVMTMLEHRSAAEKVEKTHLIRQMMSTRSPGAVRRREEKMKLKQLREKRKEQEAMATASGPPQDEAESAGAEVESTEVKEIPLKKTGKRVKVKQTKAHVSKDRKNSAIKLKDSTQHNDEAKRQTGRSVKRKQLKIKKDA